MHWNEKAEKAGLSLDDEKLDLLEEISDFNLESRYPDEKFTFYKKCTPEFTGKKLGQIKELKTWLLQRIQL